MMRLKVYCKFGTTYSKRKVWWKGFHMWLVESSIANLLNISQIGAYGFTIDYNTNLGWVVTTPEGEKIVLNKYRGECKGILFI